MALKPIIEVKSSETGPIRRMMLTGEPVTIGRDEANSLAFKDPRISRFHGVIEKKGEIFRVRDIKSRTGVHVNGKQVIVATLQPGDMIRIGPVEICFRLLDRSSKSGGKVADASGSSMAVPALADEEPPRRMADMPTQAFPTTPLLDETMVEPVEPPPPFVSATESIDAVPRAEVPALPEVPLEGTPEPEQTPLRRSVKLNMEALAAPRTIAAPPLGDDAKDVIQAATDHEQRLRQLLAAVVKGMKDAFNESNVGLVNSRNQIVHAPAAEDIRVAVKTGRDSILFLRQLLALALQLRATDLHIEPKGNDYPIRVRVDGMMVSVLNMNATIATRMLRLVKILCEMDIAQTAMVQDGHFCTDVPGRRIDYRVSFTPAMHGQKLVIRVLDQANAPGRMSTLGLPAWMAKEIAQVIHQDAGMVLMCGPTGSGKTTTLYALIREIDVSTRNVITIEDPVEYQVEGVTQMPINEAKGNTFSSLLRSVLRQDPDVILVGEIRDQETARIAMQAAVTGHLVFSTVHAQDTIGTVFRLLNLGVEPYLVASALHLVLAQRLVRVLCPQCKSPDRLTPGQMMRLGKYGVENITTVYRAIGCPRCMGTGYLGRRAIFELLAATDDLRDVILSGSQIHDMRKSLRGTLFTSLHQSGFQLVSEGVTSMDEIERVVGVAEV